jgi:hypothetical protein
MMSFYFVNIKQLRRGATWPSGDPRMCTSCTVEEAHELRRRRNQAVVVADLRHRGTQFRVPVGYCEDHIPETLEVPA